jgi:S1-C subfamily serine protease
VNSYQVKKKSSLPPWIQENLAVVLILGGTSLFVVLFLVFHFTFAPPPAQTGPILRGDLVIVMGPVKTWEEGSSTRIKAVQLKIKNRGQVPADGVVVTGVFRGVPLQLTGKKQLAVGEIADYSASLSMVVLNSDSMEFKAECPNCVPYVPPAR